MNALKSEGVYGARQNRDGNSANAMFYCILGAKEQWCVLGVLAEKCFHLWWGYWHVCR